MNTSDSLFARIYKQVVVGPTIFSRIFWFILGSPLSFGINWTIFYVASHRLGLSKAVALGISMTVMTVVFSIWNFFVNFRTTRNWSECLPRYLAALGFCSAVNYSLSLTGIVHLAHGSKLLESAVMAGSTALVSGVKFLLYHFWVYPHTPAANAPLDSTRV